MGNIVKDDEKIEKVSDEKLKDNENSVNSVEVEKIQKQQKEGNKVYVSKLVYHNKIVPNVKVLHTQH